MVDILAMENVKYTEANKAVEDGNNNYPVIGRFVRFVDDAQPDPKGRKNSNKIGIGISERGGEVTGNVASDNQEPDGATALPDNNNNISNQAPAAALLDQDVVMTEVGLALANSLARAMEDSPSDARVWTEVQFPDDVRGLVGFHPNTTVGVINSRLTDEFGAQSYFLGFQMVKGYPLSAPPQYTMGDLDKLRMDLSIGSYVKDWYEE